MCGTKVAVIGASGYSGEELLRLIYSHSKITVSCVTSRKYAGQPIGEVFPRFSESNLEFSPPDVETIAQKADVVFLALPHGLAAEFAVPFMNAGLTVIDISADFRLRNLEKYEHYYGQPHPAPQLLAEAVYGLPEFYRDALKGADLVACPGCYPTSVILPTAPLLKEKLVEPGGVTAMSMSGVTGAGRKTDLPYIFPECNESVRPYKVTGHRHLPEIEQELAAAAGLDQITLNFIPHLVPVNRGIHSTIVLNATPGTSGEDVQNALSDTYKDEPFVRVLPPGKLADTKHVFMTNICEIGCAYDDHTGRVILSSAIDNLTKGASGQAIQCLNIIRDFPENTGLA